MTELPAHGWAPAALLSAAVSAATGPYARRTARRAHEAVLAVDSASPRAGAVAPGWALALASALAGILVGVGIGWSAQLPAYLVFAASTTLLSATDVAAYRLPDSILYPAGTAALALLTTASAVDGAWTSLWRCLLAAALLGTAFLVLALIATGQLGLGDVKLSTLVGMWLGYLGWNRVLLGVLATYMLAALYIIGARLVRKTRGRTFAFGPFLFAGALAALLLRP
jgi:leader peptidase (prepilin peptidase) / N-methyltransferase